jgi:hypothetical protein
MGSTGTWSFIHYLCIMETLEFVQG